MRTDVVPSRGTILRAARTVIACHGVDVGMDAIAREAGVPVEVVTREFPTKADLVQAIVDEMVAGILFPVEAAIARVEGGASAAEALTTLVQQAAVMAGADSGVRAALSDLDLAGAPDGGERFSAALGRLVVAGQREGTVRADVTGDDVALVLCALQASDLAQGDQRRVLELVLRGITTPSVAHTA